MLLISVWLRLFTLALGLVAIDTLFEAGLAIVVSVSLEPGKDNDYGTLYRVFGIGYSA